MAFSIIIPSRNATNLVACVKAVRAAGETASIIVVDDGVDWNQCDFDRVYPQFHIVSGQKPFVFARNCNIGIRAAGEDDVDAVLGAESDGGGGRGVEAGCELKSIALGGHSGGGRGSVRKILYFPFTPESDRGRV